ncbi:MAG: DUF2341 domain-containing protein, partial [Thermoplasmata archaeon]
MIELQGRKGEVISAKAWRWENGAREKEIQDVHIVYGLSSGKIEFSVGTDVLGGITDDTKFYFEMSNWFGERDGCELAYLTGIVETRVGGDGGYGSTELTEFDGSYNKVVLVNDRYTSATKGALRLENNTVAYGGLNATDVDASGNLTVSDTRYWNGTYYFRHLKIASTGNITASSYMTVIRIYAEIIEIEGTIYLAGKGGQGGAGGTGNGGDGYTGQDGNDSSGPSPSTNGQADGGGGGGGVVMNYCGGFGGGGGAFGGSGGIGGRGAYNGSLGSDGSDGYYGRGGGKYASAPGVKPGSGGGGGSSGYGSSGYWGDGGKGGDGGGALVLCAWNVYLNGKIDVNGTGGANGNPPNSGSGTGCAGGGGGGGSGGCILITACNLTIGSNAKLYANGGRGGNGGQDPYDNDGGGGGGGGSGGAIWIYVDNAYRCDTTSISASGGPGGNGMNYGENGVNGAVGEIINPTPGIPPNPRTTFTAMQTYSPSGSYLSPVYDAGRISFWRELNITYDTHWVGTSIDVYYRVWNDTEPATWRYLATLSGGDGVSNVTLHLPDSAFGRFLRYFLTLKTTAPLCPGWPYYRAVRLDNRANPETLWNYTVNLTLDTASLIAQGKMRSDCGDIRFTDANGVQIPYWIESGINTNTTLIWVKVPLIEDATTTTIYLFYGNLSAQSTANASQTFLFFDDFESGNLNNWSTVTDGIWNISGVSHQGNYSMVANGYPGNGTKYIVAKNLNIRNVVLEAWWRLSNISGTDVSQCVRASNGVPINDYEVNWELSDWALAKMLNDNWTRISSTTSSSPNPNTWFKVSVIINASEMKFLINDSQILPASGWQTMGNEIPNGSIALRTWRVPSGHYWWIDDVRVRNYTEPEPAVHLRAERTSSNSPTVYSINLTYHKPKLLIKKVEFPQSGKHQVVLYNNDTIPILYENLYLNASNGNFLLHELSLAPHSETIVYLDEFFYNNPSVAGDFLFLNDSTAGIHGKAPNGIIDFVNWTDSSGNPPPSDGGI